MATEWFYDICATHLGVSLDEIRARQSQNGADAASTEIQRFVGADGRSGQVLYLWTRYTDTAAAGAGTAHSKTTTSAITTQTTTTSPHAKSSPTADTTAVVDRPDAVTAPVKASLEAASAPPTAIQLGAGGRLLYFIRTVDGALEPPAESSATAAGQSQPTSDGGKADGDATERGDVIPLASSAVSDYMSDRVEYGERASDVFASLSPILNDVYIPLLESMLNKAGNVVGGGSDDGEGEDETSLYSGAPGVGAGGGGPGTTMGRTLGSVVHGGGGGYGAAARSLGRTLGTTIRGGGGEGGADSSVFGGHTALSTSLLFPGGKRASVLGAGSKAMAAYAAAAGSVAVGAAGTTGGGGAGRTSAASMLPAPAEEDNLAAAVTDGVKAELRSALGRLSTAVAHTKQQLSGDIKLRIPDLHLEGSDAAIEEAAASEF